MPTLYTVGQVAKHLNVSPNTLRISWLKEFSEYLSESAVPESGETRELTTGDVVILETIAVLRQQGMGYAEIHGELQQGTRLELAERPEEAQPAQEPPQGEPGAALVTQAFSEALKRYESRLDRLEARLEETQERLLDAEKRAAAAEAKLELLEQQARDPHEARPASWWDRVRGR